MLHLADHKLDVSSILRIIQAFGCDDSAQGLLEYALMVSLVGVAAIAALSFLGQKANNSLNNSRIMLPS